MVYYAVKKYKNVPGAPVGAPGEYPAEIRFLGTSQVLPSGNGWELMSETALVTLKKSLKTQWQTFQIQSTAQKNVAVRIKQAMEFGKNLMAEYGASNVVAGRTTAEIKQIALKLANLQSLLLSGSLYAALEEIDSLTTDAHITTAVKDEFKFKIQKYLGIS